MRIRSAEPEDAQTMSEIYAKSWRVAYQGMIPTKYLISLPDNYWTKKFTKWLSDKSLKAFIAYDKNQAAGAVSYGPGRDPGREKEGEVVSLYVVPEYFGTKVGYSLLDRAVKALLLDGYETIYLWVLDANVHAKAFYKRYGFVETKDITSYDVGGKTIIDKRMVYRTY